MGTIRALRNTAPRSILSSLTTTLKTLLNPLHHHHSLFPSQTQLPSLTIKTYSTTSSDNHIYSTLPPPFTLAHQMSLTFLFLNKDHMKEAGITDTAEGFCALNVEDKDYKPKIGDGEDGGGIVLDNVAWGNRALYLANDVLLQFRDEFKLYAFRISLEGYVHVRIESLSDEYGCPSIEMLNCYSKMYRQTLVEDSASGMIPDDFGLWVGSPGLKRLLKVPDDLSRFKDLPMRVSYVESDGKEQEWVFFLSSVEKELGHCLWYLSDFDPMNKDRPVSRKEGSWRLKLPFEAHKMVTFFIQS